MPELRLKDYEGIARFYNNPILMPENTPELPVQIIVPARNEQDSIGRCLESLASQQGIAFSITVVDDGSSDKTRAIAESFRGIRVISAKEPLPGISGKCNALCAGAAGVAAKWLLFTDADTWHYPGSLAKAVAEAEETRADLLSFSPEQETSSLLERMLMPVVFADLVRTYPPDRVNDPADSVAAANGQYLLVLREAYEAVGGHQAVASHILEDVELARLFKRRGYRLRFGHGAGIVSTRMYRNTRAMWEGWTKNLALLFPHPLLLAFKRGLEFVAIVGFPIAEVALIMRRATLLQPTPIILGLMFYILFLTRIRRAHFPGTDNLLALFGLPLFVSLLLRSYIHTRIRGAVNWKGRRYAQKSAPNQG